MAQGGPQLVYARTEEEPALVRALRLAREVEQLLDEASSGSAARSAGTVSPSADTLSTRIARAMAASLVDELEAVATRGPRKSGIA